MDNQEQNIVAGLNSNEIFADALLHESIRESGTPHRFTVNSNESKRTLDKSESDMLSIYNSL
ncbi:MAG: hypothetical protein ACM3PA_00285 [Methanomassiliicoccales archaeon]